MVLGVQISWIFHSESTIMKQITAERVVVILKENGTLVTLDEAKIILSFMINLATISLEQIFENES